MNNDNKIMPKGLDSVTTNQLVHFIFRLEIALLIVALLTSVALGFIGIIFGFFFILLQVPLF